MAMFSSVVMPSSEEKLTAFKTSDTIQNDHMLTTSATMMHKHNTVQKGDFCKECAFEREKRTVT
jgi:hypothetical protein